MSPPTTAAMTVQRTVHEHDARELHNLHASKSFHVGYRYGSITTPILASAPSSPPILLLPAPTKLLQAAALPPPLSFPVSAPNHCSHCCCYAEAAGSAPLHFCRWPCCQCPPGGRLAAVAHLPAPAARQEVRSRRKPTAHGTLHGAGALLGQRAATSPSSGGSHCNTPAGDPTKPPWPAVVTGARPEALLPLVPTACSAATCDGMVNSGC